MVPGHLHLELTPPRRYFFPVLTTDGYTHLHLQSACLQGPALGPILGGKHQQKSLEITGEW